MDRPSRGGDGDASSPHLHVPIDRTSRGNDGSGGGSWSSLHSAFFALGSNASGLAVVASTAPLAGSMLVVPWVGAGAAFASDDTLPGSCASTSAHSMGSAPAFPAAWTGPEHTPPG